MTVAPSEIVVVSYNLRSLRDSPSASASVVAHLGADVALLQETPRFLRWRSRLAGWSRRAGLFYAAGGGDAGGVAVLAGLRLDVEATFVIALTPHRGRHRRALAVTVTRYGNRRLLALSAHLSLDAEERAGHLLEIAGHLDRLRTEHRPDVVMLGADVNEPAGGPTWQGLAAAGLQDSCDLVARASTGQAATGPTFPAAAPTRRIDAIFLTGRVEVLEAGVPTQPAASPAYAVASDHVPVLARLRLV